MCAYGLTEPNDKPVLPVDYANKIAPLPANTADRQILAADLCRGTATVDKHPGCISSEEKEMWQVFKEICEGE